MGKLITTNAEVVEALKDLPAQMQRFTAEVQAGFQQFEKGQALKGCRSIPLDRGPLLWGGPGRLLGYSVRVTNQAMAAWLRDGRDRSGPIIAVISSQNGNTMLNFTPSVGISFTEALYLDVVFGNAEPLKSLEGAIYIGAAD